MTFKDRFGLILALAVSGTLTILLFIACQFVFHATLLSLFFNFVIAAGGAAFGFLASLGVIPWARLSGTRPTGRIRLVVVCAALLSLLLFYVTMYGLAVAASVPEVKSAGFLGYMDAIHGHAQMRMHSSDDVPTDIGRAGYAMLALNFAWAAIMACFPTSFLRDKAHCDGCSKYFKSRKKQSIIYIDEDEFSRAIADLPTSVPERARSVMRLEQWKKIKEKRGAVRFDLHQTECPSCDQQSMEECVSMHNGNHFVRINRMNYRWNPTASARSEHQAMKAPVGFGRKGLST